MKFKALINQVSSDFIAKSIGLSLSTKDDIKTLHNELHKLATDKIEVTVEIKKFRKSRSLDANAMFWKICGEIAGVLRTNKDDVYLEMLSSYGVYTHVVVKPNMVERVKQEWRTVRELGEVTINGQTGIQMQCFFGSSTYDSKEFAILLDGVISEAKELGISVMDESDKMLLLNEWGK
jgi:hypothetical protein